VYAKNNGKRQQKMAVRFLFLPNDSKEEEEEEEEEEEGR
jgi:hypothetical protein